MMPMLLIEWQSHDFTVTLSGGHWCHIIMTPFISQFSAQPGLTLQPHGFYRQEAFLPVHHHQLLRWLKLMSIELISNWFLIPSVIPFSPLQSFLQQFFTSGAKVFEFQFQQQSFPEAQDWFLGIRSLISLHPDLQVSPATTVQKYQFFQCSASFIAQLSRSIMITEKP